MTVAPLPADEAERLTALYETGLLDSAPEQRFDRITRLAKQLFSTDIALISLIDEHRQWFKSKIGMDECETARELSFCAHAILSDDILLVPDTLLDARFVNHPAVAADNGIRFYAGAPLHHPKGYRLGTLCLASSAPRQFDGTEQQHLRDLADIVEREIAEGLLQEQFIEWQQERSQLQHFEQQQLQLSALQADILAAPQLFATEAGAAWHYLTEKISQALQAPRVSIWLFNDDGSAMVAQSLFDRATYQYSQGTVLHKDSYPSYFAALQTNRVIAIDDAQQNPITAEFNHDYLQPLAIFSMLDAVIVSEQGMVGVICAEQVGTLRHWQRSEQNFMTAMASVASTVHSYLQQNELHKELTQALQQRDQLTDLLQNVMDAASEVGIIATDSSGVIELFNHGAERMLGYTASELIGQATPALFHIEAEVQQRAEALTESLGYPVKGFRAFVELAERHGSENRQWMYRRKDGSMFPVQLLVTPRRQQDGSIHGYLGIAYDISERLRLQEMKNEFISTVSHELRTPLTSINGALGLVLSGTLGKLSEQVHSLLKVAASNTKRLNFLINDLLDIEKLEAGKMQFDMVHCALLPLVEQAIADNQTYGHKRQIQLVLDNQLQQPSQVLVDPQRLLQVLANLLSNAIKFSPEQGRVQITLLTQQQNVRVEVHDKGSGISADFRAKIFQKFSQADSTSSRAQSGTGLGLALSKELMEAMDGQIGFTSEPGQGSCFYIELKATSEQ
ncbi:MAG: GAF domain-containing protein [Alkalimonas sp.]|nr:GAF domain-containing protein [Alkalimonas sp.]